MRFVTALVCTLLSTLVVADERFYTTVDAQGRVQVIKSEQSSHADVPKQSLPSPETVVTEPEKGQKKTRVRCSFGE